MSMTPLPLIPLSDGNDSSVTPDDLSIHYLPRRLALTSDDSECQSKFVQRKRKKRGAVLESDELTPDWLMENGWKFENRVRTGGATAGVTDKFYYDPIEGHQFRSLKEVYLYCKTGSRPSRGKGKNAKANVSALDCFDPCAQSGSNWVSKRVEKPASNFDFPKKVRWVFTSDGERSRLAFVGDERVPESYLREWAVASASLAH